MKNIGALVLLLICIAINYVLGRIGISSSLYRLTCFRYLFLAVPAYMLLDVKKYNKILLSVLAVISLFYLTVLYRIDLSPLTLDYGWSVQQWPAYFWTILVFMFLSFLAKNKFNKGRISVFICWLGVNSWYIFLAQMFIINYMCVDVFGCIGNSIVRVLLYSISVFILSIISAYIIERIKLKVSNYNQ